jgi:hypothetical protein
MMHSGTTCAPPSQVSSRRRYEHPVAKAISVARPTGHVLRRDQHELLGERLSTSRSFAGNGSATNAASTSWLMTFVSKAAVVPITRSIRTSGYAR